MKRHLKFAAGLLCGILTLAAARAQDRIALKDVRTFMIQTGKLESVEAVEKLARSPYDMLVVDTMSTVKPTAQVDMRPVVAKLREGHPRRLVLCYVDVAEAEAYRTYWQDGWHPPGIFRKAKPDFILGDDPEGWDHNYPVAYWDPQWRDILATGPDSTVRHIMSEGFDGLLLDWVQGHADPTVVARAKQQGVNPDKAMVDLISAVRDAARTVNPAALIIPQNGRDLIDRDSRICNVIDGILFEKTWFGGKADRSWGDSSAGDIPTPGDPAARVAQEKKYLAAGKPVFTVDYCLKPDNAARVYAQSRAAGFVPLVTQSSLEGITTTPPPSLKETQSH